MTKEELAAKMNGRQYQEEITPAEESDAKQSRLVAIFGASDDLCELRGAIHDEVGAYNSTTIYILAGKLVSVIADEDVEVLAKYGALEAVKKAIDGATKVIALWCKTHGWSWTIETDAPHAKFEIMEDSDGFCMGIVLDLNELASGEPQGETKS